MRSALGMLVYATDTGLGRQTELLYRLLKPDRVMLVDLSTHNYMPIHEDWYRYDIRTTGYPTNEDVDKFLDGIDAVFLCETPLNYYLLARAKQLGIKTVVQPNPEFFDYFQTADLPTPSVFGLPSAWMERELQSVAGQSAFVRLPVPVDKDCLPKRHVTRADTFFHIAGRPAHGDRNGTLDFIRAARMAQPHEPGMKFILYCQQPTREIERALDGSQIEVISHVEDYAELYARGDILVLPRKYGGLCLPCQEAVGSGIPVLMPNISPNNAWLPSNWLLPVGSYPHTFRPRGSVEMWDVDMLPMAQKMLDLYRDPPAVQAMAEQARDLAQTLTWEHLEPIYREVLA